MSVPDPVPIRNRILSMLARTEYRRLEPSLERVDLHADAVLRTPGDAVRSIYFPDNAVVSLLIQVDERRILEVAMQGSEGAVGLVEYLAGMKSCNRSVVCHPGTAMRLEVDSLRRHTNHRGRLQGLLHKSVHALVIQVSQSAICNRFHSVDARFARWLLMTRDRVGAGEFRATQESIARMLGVRRSGITAAAKGFQKRDMIDYRRGRIEILDQDSLGDTSCPCYGIVKRQFDSFLD